MQLATSSENSVGFPSDGKRKVSCFKINVDLMLLIFSLLTLEFVISSFLGVKLPLIRALVGFIFLSFVPGFLALRIISINNLEITTKILISVGLSLTFIMVNGVILNTFLPYIGISRPISVLSLTISLVTLSIVLFLFSCSNDYNPWSIRLTKIIEWNPSLPAAIFLLLIPIISILATLSVNFYNSNTLLLILLPSIAIIPVSVILNRFIPKNLYPLAIWAISIALLFQGTLMSSYLVGWDIHSENFYQNLVVANGLWNQSIPDNLAAMLSINIICPTYSLVLDLESIWVFKIIYPFIFSLVPLAMFELFQSQFGEKRSFLSVFLFMSVLTFFSEMTELARQETAEFFFLILLILLFDNKIVKLKRRMLIILFMMDLVVSHYGLAYICAALFLGAWILLAFAKKNSENYEDNLSLRLLILYAIFLFVWYIYTSSGNTFTNIVLIINNIFLNIGEILNPTSRETLVLTSIGMDLTKVSLMGKLFRILQFSIQALILVGIFYSLIDKKNSRLQPLYVALTIISSLILGACIAIPIFSSYLNVSRIYHIAMIILSPFCILGGEVILGFVLNKLKFIKQYSIYSQFENNPPNSTINKINFTYMVLFLFLLMPYYLFNTGYLFEITKHQYQIGDIPSSISLSNYRVDYPDYNSKEANGAQWLARNLNNDSIVYGDEYGRLILQDFLRGKLKYDRFPPFLENVSKRAFIFLREWNIEDGSVILFIPQGAQVNIKRQKINETPELLSLINSREEIFENSGVKVYSPG